MKEAAKSHGLDGTMVDPDWAALAIDEVRDVLRNFPAVGEAVAIASTSPRPFSAASIVQTDRERVFVKRHVRSVRDREGLAEEHRFMCHLRARGISVPEVFRTGSGFTAFEYGPWTYEVHQVPAGEDLYEQAVSWTPFQSVEHAHSAGVMLAESHVAAQGFDAPRRKVRPLVASFTIFAAENPAEALEEYLQARPALDQSPLTRRDAEDGLELLAPFHAELKPLLALLPSLWTHNDLHASNLFWSGANRGSRAASVIDFGLADRTNAVYDLVQAIERNMVEWLELMRDPDAGDRVQVHLGHLWAFLDGYQRVRELSRSEASAVAPMVALGHAEFALTEADYFLRILGSAERARVASSDYLVGHARWFRGPGRQKLLEPLRNWAETQGEQAVRG